MPLVVCLCSRKRKMSYLDVDGECAESRSRNAERCLCRSLASAARKEIACFEQLSRIDQCCVSVMDCRYWNELYNMKHHLRRWGKSWEERERVRVGPSRLETGSTLASGQGPRVEHPKRLRGSVLSFGIDDVNHHSWVRLGRHERFIISGGRGGGRAGNLLTILASNRAQDHGDQRELARHVVDCFVGWREILGGRKTRCKFIWRSRKFLGLGRTRGMELGCWVFRLVGR